LEREREYGQRPGSGQGVDGDLDAEKEQENKLGLRIKIKKAPDFSEASYRLEPAFAKATADKVFSRSYSAKRCKLLQRLYIIPPIPPGIPPGAPWL
jgi:hypothetical protein